MASTQLSLHGLLPAELFDRLCSLLSSYSDSGTTLTMDETCFTSETPIKEDVRLRRTLYSLASDYERTEWTLNTLSRPEPARLTPEFMAQVVVKVPISLHDLATARKQPGDGRDDERQRANAFVKALGFEQGPTVRQKGVKFTRGLVDICVTQFLADTDEDRLLDDKWYLVTVTSSFALPKAEPNARNASTNAAQQHAANNTSSSTPGTPSQQQQSGGAASGGGAKDASAQTSRSRAEAKLRDTKQLLRGLVKLERGVP